MKHSTDSKVFHTCDFCGMSSKGDVSMFISPLDESTAICKPCVDGLPMVWGKIIEFSRQVTGFGADRAGANVVWATDKIEISGEKKEA